MNTIKTKDKTIELYDLLTEFNRTSAFQKALSDVEKSVIVNIADQDLTTLKKSGYKLCFAKKIAGQNYNVVWQSYDGYLSVNTFSWVPMYSLFGSNTFKTGVKVQVSTETQEVKLGQTCLLDQEGLLHRAIDGGKKTCFTLDNQYGPIHPGVNQISIGIGGETISTPIYVAEDPVVIGMTELTPVEMVMVWFEQNVQTSTMFSDSKSKSLEIDLTNYNSQTVLYQNGEWKIVE